MAVGLHPASYMTHEAIPSRPPRSPERAVGALAMIERLR